MLDFEIMQTHMQSILYLSSYVILYVPSSLHSYAARPLSLSRLGTLHLVYTFDLFDLLVP